MLIQVRLFATARDSVGRDRIELELPEAATIAELREALVEKYPTLTKLMPHLMFAIDSEYAPAEAVIRAGAEIAVIPPVSGG